MPRPYNPQQKANALEILSANGGDIARTQHETGIAERTLYRWRNELWQSWRRQIPPPTPPSPPPEFTNDLEALAFLRFQIMKELVKTANNFQGDLSLTSPSQRVNLLSQLLDRLLKLDEHLKPYKPAEALHIVFTWDAGIYVRGKDGYRGPFTPGELPKRWREIYGPNARLEMYWGDDTFTLIPEGEFMETLMQTRDFLAERCELAAPADEETDRRYGWRYG